MPNISERRIERLFNPQLNDLPPFLSPEQGLQSGAMIMQLHPLVSENKTLATPGKCKFHSILGEPRRSCEFGNDRFKTRTSNYSKYKKSSGH
jgi:hypothetical protein